MKLFILTLLVAGAVATHGVNPKFDRVRRSDDGDATVESSTSSAPTTTPPLPTRGPLAGCESCINSKLSVSDSFAGHCFPHQSGGSCNCICGDVFCNHGQTIDRTTCVSGGSLSDCKCVDNIISSTASTSTTS